MEQYDLFLNSLRSEYTKRVYTIVFKKYMDFIGENDLFCGNNPKLIEKKIINFIVSLRDKGLGQSAISNYVKAILAFYKINDFVLNTDKISKFIPEYRKVKKDNLILISEIGPTGYQEFWERHEPINYVVKTFEKQGFVTDDITRADE